jgi:hypothetical protein
VGEQIDRMKKQKKERYKEKARSLMMAVFVCQIENLLSGEF